VNVSKPKIVANINSSNKTLMVTDLTRGDMEELHYTSYPSINAFA
jgi:hypothetical protein